MTDKTAAYASGGYVGPMLEHASTPRLLGECVIPSISAEQLERLRQEFIRAYASDKPRARIAILEHTSPRPSR